MNAEDRMAVALARVRVEQAEAALANATEPFERALRAYRGAELELSQAKLAEADVLDRISARSAANSSEPQPID